MMLLHITAIVPRPISRIELKLDIDLNDEIYMSVERRLAIQILGLVLARVPSGGGAKLLSLGSLRSLVMLFIVFQIIGGVRIANFHSRRVVPANELQIQIRLGFLLKPQQVFLTCYQKYPSTLLLFSAFFRPIRAAQRRRVVRVEFLRIVEVLVFLTHFIIAFDASGFIIL